MAIFKKTFTPKIDKLSFKEVAKKAGLTGLTSKKFKDQAISVLHKSGMAQSAIKGILSGQRKVQPETLKKVFKKLSEGKVIKSSQGSGLVTSYIKKEKEQQIRMHDYKMSLRKQDLVEERAKEAQKEVQTNNKESSTTAPQLSTSVILTPVKGDKKQELPTSDIALNNKVLKNKKLKQETSPQPQESPKLEDMVID